MKTGVPLGADEALVICGGMTRRVRDRYLDAESVHPVHVVTNDTSEPCLWFDRFEPRTVMSFLPERDDQVVFATMDDVVRLNLAGGESQRFPLEGMDDIHELAFSGDRILVANTGGDEVVELDRQSGEQRNRYSLARFRDSHAKPDPRSATESFHANQAIIGLDGHLLVLVHHIGGYRVIANARRRLVGHGNGGVIDFTTGEQRNLALQGPHSLRRFRDGWIVADSGRHELLTLTNRWEPRDRYKLTGWARGLVLDDEQSLAYVGISATVRRYARRGDRAKTGLEVIDLSSGQRSFLAIPSMEAVDWVQLVSRQVAEALLDLPGSTSAARQGAQSPGRPAS